LLRPDTYIGSIEHQHQTLWVLEEHTGKLIYKDIVYVPGLYKIFDEILVNAADNFQRDKSMNLIEIVIDPEANKISVWNNGKGIPITMHREHKCYVPAMIFGQLLTSSNYDDTEKKTTGGRNGFGAKLANIFSTKFMVETGEARSMKHYTQTFRNNMQDQGDPVISTLEKKQNFTCITFWPDLAKFKMQKMDSGIISLMSKRAYDLAGVTDGKVTVTLNGQPIRVKNFDQYCDLYLKNKESLADELPKIVEKKHDRWEIAASLSDG